MINHLKALILSNFKDTTGLSNDVSLLVMAPKPHVPITDVIDLDMT